MSALRERMRMRCHASRDAPQRIARPDAPAPLATSVAGGGPVMVPSVSNVLNPAWIAAIGTALSGQAEVVDLPSGTTTGAAAVLQPVRPIYSHATWHPAAVTAIRVVDIAGRRWVRVTGDSWRRYRQSPIGWIFSKYQLFRLRRVRLPGRLTPGASSSHGSKNDGFGGGGLEGAWRQVPGGDLIWRSGQGLMRVTAIDRAGR